MVVEDRCPESTQQNAQTHMKLSRSSCIVADHSHVLFGIQVNWLAGNNAQFDFSAVLDSQISDSDVRRSVHGLLTSPRGGLLQPDMADRFSMGEVAKHSLLQ